MIVLHYFENGDKRKKKIFFYLLNDIFSISNFGEIGIIKECFNIPFFL
jgi:hypothetical protein